VLACGETDWPAVARSLEMAEPCEDESARRLGGGRAAAALRVGKGIAPDPLVNCGQQIAKNNTDRRRAANVSV
jgi:hypothetical protein